MHINFEKFWLTWPSESKNENSDKLNGEFCAGLKTVSLKNNNKSYNLEGNQTSLPKFICRRK